MAHTLKQTWAQRPCQHRLPDTRLIAGSLLQTRLQSLYWELGNIWLKFPHKVFMMQCTFYPRKEKGENREVHALSWRCCPENFDDKWIYCSSPLPHWSGWFPSAYSESSRKENSCSKESQKVWKVSKILHFFKKIADHFSVGWDVPQKKPYRLCFCAVKCLQTVFLDIVG